MEYDYSKLRGLIREVFGIQTAFAVAMGLSPCSLSKKLNNKSEWKKREMHKSGELLGFSEDQIPQYFFTPKVEKSQQE